MNEISEAACSSCGWSGQVTWLKDEPTECPLCGRCNLHGVNEEND